MIYRPPDEPELFEKGAFVEPNGTSDVLYPRMNSAIARQRVRVLKRFRLREERKPEAAK